MRSDGHARSKGIWTGRLSLLCDEVAPLTAFTKIKLPPQPESIPRLTRHLACDARIPGLFQPSSHGIWNTIRRADRETSGRRQKAWSIPQT